MEPLNAEDFKEFSEILLRSSGIVLKHNQQYLIESRLASMGRDLGITNFHDLLLHIRRNPAAATRMVDLMTTNETLWFRDQSCWDIVQKVLFPKMVELLETGKRQEIRIWSAASSTGQEAYSTTLLLWEYLNSRYKQNLFNKFKIIGTDISTNVVDFAKKAEYDSFSLARGMSSDRVARYFEREGDRFTLKPEFRKLSEFRLLNLMNDFSLLGKFDIIFIRNVAIYFSEPTKIDLFRRVSRLLHPESYLMLGSTESLYGLTEDLETKSFEQGFYYQLKTKPS